MGTFLLPEDPLLCCREAPWRAPCTEWPRPLRGSRQEGRSSQEDGLVYFRACFYLGELPNSPGHKVQVRRRLLLTVNF